NSLDLTTAGFDTDVDVTGGAGDDTIDAGASGMFDLTKGGNDTVVATGKFDLSRFGATFTAADSVSGGQVEIEGNYAGKHALTLGANTLNDVATLSLLGAFKYDITENNGNLSAGAHMSVDGFATSGLVFDGSAETDGTFDLSGSQFADVLKGGAQD